MKMHPQKNNTRALALAPVSSPHGWGTQVRAEPAARDLSTTQHGQHYISLRAEVLVQAPSG